MPFDVKAEELQRLGSRATPNLTVWMGFGPLSSFPLTVAADGIAVARELELPIAEHTMENVEEQRRLLDSFRTYLTQHGSRLSPSDRAAAQSVVVAGAPPLSDAWLEIRRRAAELVAELSADTSPDSLVRRALSDSLSTIGLDAEPSYASPVPFLDHLGALPGFLAIHAVWPTADDIQRYRRHGVAVSYNPESNMYLSSGVAPVVRYLRAGVLVSLGTDGAASNDGIDMFSAMRAAVNLQKVRALDPGTTAGVNPWTVLQMATINGARALGRLDRLGSLAIGKEADIILLSTKRLGLAPWIQGKNDASLLVNSASPRSITMVLADGRIVVSKGRLTEVEESTLAEGLSAAARAVVDRATTGKSWKEQHVLGADDSVPWFRYRSIRLPDQVRLTVENGASSARCVDLAFSGTTFGGRTPMALRPATLARFPLEPPRRWWMRHIRLAPRERLMVEKQSGDTTYVVSTAGAPEPRNGPAAEQLYLSAGSCDTPGPRE